MYLYISGKLIELDDPEIWQETWRGPLPITVRVPSPEAI